MNKKICRVPKQPLKLSVAAAAVLSRCISTGVRQGCILSTILFILVIDWVMKKNTEDK